ncbi:MAG: hypothetical protein JWO12_352 [Frankiales bacterium]|nr:hypothetical protein [Frankiales bacterium]
MRLPHGDHNRVSSGGATPVAASRSGAHTHGVPVVSSFHFLLGPVIAAAALGLIILICRWVFSTDHREDRTGRRTQKAVGDLGLLVAVATVRTRDDAEMLKGVLADAGIRAGISGEYEVLVFGKDLDRARSLVGAR